MVGKCHQFKNVKFIAVYHYVALFAFIKMLFKIDLYLDSYINYNVYYSQLLKTKATD